MPLSSNQCLCSVKLNPGSESLVVDHWQPTLVVTETGGSQRYIFGCTFATGFYHYILLFRLSGLISETSFTAASGSSSKTFRSVAITTVAVLGCLYNNIFQLCGRNENWKQVHVKYTIIQILLPLAL